MTECDKCRSEAIIYQKYSGMHLCGDHFEQDVHRKIRESIRETGVFAHSAQIAVAISGGKDSCTLLYALKTLFCKRPNIELTAIMVDEGIEGYRPKKLEFAKALAERLEIPYVVRNVKEAFNMTIDMMAAQESDQRITTCTAETTCRVCEAMRKIVLSHTARELNADALATGHNLDDEAQAIMQNYLRGDVDSLFRLRPRRTQPCKAPSIIPLIKPLRRIPEKEIALYALTHDLLLQDSKASPLADEAFHTEVGNVLNDFEDRHPGTKYSLLRSLERMLELEPDSIYQACQRCGEPSPGTVCQRCRMLEDIFRGQSL